MATGTMASSYLIDVGHEHDAVNLNENSVSSSSITTVVSRPRNYYLLNKIIHSSLFTNKLFL
jgi:hypothetical protein